MPVFLFALLQAEEVNVQHTILLFITLHLFIYPASNAYNSYMDQDEGPIGGLKNPPKATRLIFYLSILFDIIGVTIAFFISMYIAAGVLIYILASRAYSYKRIRLKKMPVIGFLTVAFFQGAFIYILTCIANNTDTDFLKATISSLLIGGVYPLTQIYQHDEDRKNGDITISILLGYRGTFVFTAILFVIATCLMYLALPLFSFLVIQLFMLPVVSYFFYWTFITWNNSSSANFTHTMRMNALASIMLNLCFLTLIILR
jgi:1,4-dihydroxy-2-naphthoate octaprenyltransferase